MASGGVGASGPESRLLEHIGMVHHIVRGVLRRAGMEGHTMDVVHDVLLKAWLNLHTFRGESELHTWLGVVARNTAIKAIQLGRNRIFQLQQDLIVEEESVVDYTPDWSFVSRIQRVIAALPDVQRIPLLLVVHFGYTRVEVAQLLDWPLGTVNSRIRSAKAHLRATLHGFFPDGAR